jgi:flagellar hook-length control protein FliK
MSLSEAKEALPPNITNLEVSGDIEMDAGFQSRVQKEPAPIIAPQSAPLVIESALPKSNDDEAVVAAQKDMTAQASAKTATDEPVPQVDKVPVVEAEARVKITPEKTASDTQTVAPAVQTENASVKSSELPIAPQSAQPLSELQLPKTNSDGMAVSAQSKDDEAAQKATEAPVAEAEVKNSAAKSERPERAESAMANTQPEPTSQVGKGQQTGNSHASQVSTAESQRNERQSGAQSNQSDTHQNQPQNTSEADEIKDPRNINGGENHEFKTKFNAALNSGAQAQHVAEAKAAPNTIPTAHTENTFSATNAELPTAAPSQPSIFAPKQFLPPHSPMSQLEGSVRWLLRTDAKGAEIQLHPENLGRVTVSLRVDGSQVHARVWATEASTVPLLEGHKAFLESSLKEQGLTLSSFDLHHGRGGQQAQSDTQNHHQHFAPPMMESWTGTEFRQELPAQLVAQHVDDGRVELYA